jgi:hypothetical protein
MSCGCNSKKGWGVDGVGLGSQLGCGCCSRCTGRGCGCCPKCMGDNIGRWMGCRCGRGEVCTCGGMGSMGNINIAVKNVVHTEGYDDGYSEDGGCGGEGNITGYSNMEGAWKSKGRYGL